MMRTETNTILRWTALFLLVLTPTLPAGAAENFPDRTTMLGQPLQKLGDARYVYRYFFKVYDAALYTTREAGNDGIVDGENPLLLEFHYHRKIDRSIILKSSARMLEKNLTAEEREQINDRVEQINAAYPSVEPGDRSSLAYQPGTGTILTVNGQEKIIIPGEDFARLYFQIWLGDEPICRDLKEDLLGG